MSETANNGRGRFIRAFGLATMVLLPPTGLVWSYGVGQMDDSGLTERVEPCQQKYGMNGPYRTYVSEYTKRSVVRCIIGMEKLSDPRSDIPYFEKSFVKQETPSHPMKFVDACFKQKKIDLSIDPEKIDHPKALVKAMDECIEQHMQKTYHNERPAGSIAEWRTPSGWG